MSVWLGKKSKAKNEKAFEEEDGSRSRAFISLAALTGLARAGVSEPFYLEGIRPNLPAYWKQPHHGLQHSLFYAATVQANPISL